jgi:hypothetical protein
MTVQKNMEQDLFALLSRLIAENDDDTPYRLDAQEDALAKLKCSQPALGEWIDRCDYSFLMATLNLNDRIFMKEFTGVRLALAERQRFAETLTAHSEICAHCHLKRSYDQQWESCIDKALVENREAIGKALGHAAGKK